MEQADFKLAETDGRHSEPEFRVAVHHETAALRS
jgi:hypothetical protein